MDKRILFAHKIRFLTQILLLSVILNIAFLIIFFYFFIRENPVPVVFSYQPSFPTPEKLYTNQEVIKTFEHLPVEKLFSLLEDDRLIEEGIKARDLSLALLVFRDHLDIDRAFGKKMSPHRILKLENGAALPLFSGFSDEEYKQVSSFVALEKWPFSFDRLFPVIKSQGESADPALLQMFFQSEECFAVERLFSQGPIALQKKVLLSLLREGSYETLHAFSESQKACSDTSQNKRLEFLMNYIKEGSKTAALLLLYTDLPYVTKYADDKMVLTILKLLPERSEKGFFFAATLLNSLRSDAVKRQAEEFLSHDKELAHRFYNRPALGNLRPTFRDKPPAAPPPSQHVVQPGESLWSIARKYNISVEELVKINHLPTTSLQSGRILKLY